MNATRFMREWIYIAVDTLLQLIITKAPDTSSLVRNMTMIFGSIPLSSLFKYLIHRHTLVLELLVLLNQFEFLEIRFLEKEWLFALFDLRRFLFLPRPFEGVALFFIFQILKTGFLKVEGKDDMLSWATQVYE